MPPTSKNSASSKKELADSEEELAPIFFLEQLRRAEQEKNKVKLYFLRRARREESFTLFFTPRPLVRPPPSKNLQAICQPNASIALTSIDYKTIALLLC